MFAYGILQHMRKEYSPTVAFRIPKGLMEFMDWDLETHCDHKSRTEYLVTALREYEEKRAIKFKQQTGGGGRQIPIKGLAPRLII